MNKFWKPSRTTATSWRWLFGTIALALMLAGLDLVVACGRTETVVQQVEQVAAPAKNAVAPAPAPTSTKQADDELVQARQLMQQHDDQALRQHQADAERIDLLTHQRDQLADDAARTRLALTASLLIAAGIAFAIVAIILSTGRGLAVMASVGSFAGAALALIVRALYGWLTWIGGAVSAGFAAYAAWQIARHKRTTVEAAAHGDRVETAIKDALKDWEGMPEVIDGVLAKVKAVSAQAQADAGIGKLLAAIRGKPHKPPTPMQPPSPPPAGAAA